MFFLRCAICYVWTMKKRVYIFEENTDKVDLSEYTHIRVYHACRPTNINKYLENGIHDFSKKETYEFVKDRLSQCGIDEMSIRKYSIGFNERLV